MSVSLVSLHTGLLRHVKVSYESPEPPTLLCFTALPDVYCFGSCATSEQYDTVVWVDIFGGTTLSTYPRCGKVHMTSK